MKKMLMLLGCVLLLSGCEKEMEIIETKDGYEIEKIGDISSTGIGYGEICGENKYCFHVQKNQADSYERETVASYEIDLTTKKIKKVEIDNEKDKLKGRDYMVVEDVTEDVAYDENGFERTTQYHTWTYKSALETKEIYNCKFENQNGALDPCLTMYEYQGHYYFYDQEEKDSVVYEIVKGGTFKEVDRVPKKIDDYYANNTGMYPFYVENPMKENALEYQNETSKRNYYGDEYIEYDLNQTCDKIDDYIFMNTETQLGFVTETKIIDFDTKKETILPICFDGFKIKLKKKNAFIQYFTNHEVSYVEVFDNQLIMHQLPFDTSFLLNVVNENQVILFKESDAHDKIEFYIMTIE